MSKRISLLKKQRNLYSTFPNSSLRLCASFLSSQQVIIRKKGFCIKDVKTGFVEERKTKDIRSADPND